MSNSAEISLQATKNISELDFRYNTNRYSNTLLSNIKILCKGNYLKVMYKADDSTFGFLRHLVLFNSFDL